MNNTMNPLGLNCTMWRLWSKLLYARLAYEPAKNVWWIQINKNWNLQNTKLMFEWTVHLLYCTGSSQWFFHFGEETIIAWTPEKPKTLGGTETHHSSWQFKELHRRCCHGSRALLAMGDSGTFTMLTWFQSIWLRSLRQIERTTARPR